MASELQPVSQNSFSIQGSTENAILHCGDKIYHVGKIQSLVINRDGSCDLHCSRYTLIIPAEKADQLVPEFLRTWGMHHLAPLHTFSPLKAVGYDHKNSQWVLRFDGEEKPAALDALAGFLNQEDSFQTQKDRILLVVQDIMGYTINEKAFSRISAQKNKSADVTQNRPKIPPPYAPLENHAYKLNSEGIVTDWINWFRNASILIKGDPQIKQNPEKYSHIQAFASLLEALGEQFPIQNQKIEKFTALIKGLTSDEETLLRKHLGLGGGDLFTAVNGALRAVSAHHFSMMVEKYGY